MARIRGLAPWVVGLLLVGCVSREVVVTRGNRPYPPNPASCDLTFDYADTQSRLKLLPGHVAVASLELPYQPEEFRWTKALQEHLRMAACRTGGDVVLYAGTRRISNNPGGGLNWGQFEVYRKKRPTDPGSPLF